jgi:hypothetical protein
MASSPKRRTSQRNLGLGSTAEDLDHHDVDVIGEPQVFEVVVQEEIAHELG